MSRSSHGRHLPLRGLRIGHLATLLGMAFLGAGPVSSGTGVESGKQLLSGRSHGWHVGIDVPGNTAYPPLAFGRLESLPLEAAPGLPVVAGILYENFGIFMSRSYRTLLGGPRLDKIDLSTFQRVATLQFEYGDGGGLLQSGRFAYLLRGPATVLRVDLKTLQLAGTASLEADGLYTRAFVSEGFAYFRRSTGLQRLELSTMQPAGSLSLPPEDGFIVSAVASGKFAYLGTRVGGYSFRIVKVNLQTFRRVGAISLTQGELLSPVALASGGFAYFPALGDFGATGKLIKIDLGGFERTGALDLPPEDVAGGAVAPGSAYLWTSPVSGEPGTLLRVDLGAFEVVQSVPLQPEDSPASAGILKGTDLFLGVGPMNLGRIARFRLPALVRDETLDLGSIEMSILVAAAADGFGYFGTLDSIAGPSRVVKVDLGTFTRVASLALPVENFSPTIALTAGGFGYFVGESLGPRIFKIDLSTFQIADAAALGQGESSLRFGAISGNYGYFGFNSPVRKIVKLDLRTLIRAGELTFPDEDRIDSAVAAGGDLYVGSSSGWVHKIDLSTFSEVDSLELSLHSLPIAFASDGSVYFAESSSDLFKIDLQGFREVDSLTFESNPLNEAVTLGDVAYPQYLTVVPPGTPLSHVGAGSALIAFPVLFGLVALALRRRKLG